MSSANSPRDVEHNHGEDSERIATNNPPAKSGPKAKTVKPSKQGGYHAA